MFTEVVNDDDARKTAMVLEQMSRVREGIKGMTEEPERKEADLYQRNPRGHSGI